MKESIHPDYKPSKILCACGTEIVTRSTAGDFHIEICSSCHPFFTGKQKIMDTAGRIERFKNRYAAKPDEKPAPKKAAAPAKAEPKKAAAPAENRAAKRAKAGKTKKAEAKPEAAPAAAEEKPAE